MTSTYFEDCLEFSLNQDTNDKVKAIIFDKFLGAEHVYKASTQDDKKGIDFWVECSNRNSVKVDCKIRKHDFALEGADVIAIETWSNVENLIPGWSRDFNKKTDYILWYWIDTERSVIVPFPLLCKVVYENWMHWSATYQLARQETKFKNSDKSYHSECVFVPRLEVWKQIFNVFGGNL